jgi:predicted transcriptional regulator
MTTAIRPTSVKLDDVTKERVNRLAAARDRTPHWMILEAIHQYVEREEKRETLRSAAVSAWADYQETGLHVSVDAADDWLTALSAGEDREAPECQS